MGFDRVGLEVNSSEGSIMSTVAIPNEIRAGQSLDPRPVMANFDELALFINDDVLTLDGSKAMTGHLTLSGPGVAGGHAVTKAQLDDAVGGDVAGGGFLPLGGGTLTGQLVQRFAQDVSGPGTGGLLVGYTGTSSTHIAIDGNEIQAYSDGKPSSLNLNIEGTGSKGPVSVGGDLLVRGSLTVDGKEVYTKAKANDQVYTKKEIDDLLAARPLMKMCDRPTRVYDQEPNGGLKALTWYKIQLPSTVGGVARSGAKAAYVNMTTVVAAKDSWVAVRPDGSNWNPNDPSAQYSTMNITEGDVDNEHCWMQIGSNGAIQFWVHGDSPSDKALNRLVLDVIALVF